MTVNSVRIETARLLLRPISPADAPELGQMYAHPDVSRYLRPLDAMETARQVQGFIDEWAEQGFGIFSMLHRASGEFLGRSGQRFEQLLRPTEHLNNAGRFSGLVPARSVDREEGRDSAVED